MPLFQPLTLPPIFQALFFLHNLSQELSCLCPHLSLVWGTVCLFLWLASMKLYYSLVLRDHRIFCSSTVLFNVHASQPTCKKESSWFLSYLKNKRLINELPYFCVSQLSCWHTESWVSSWVPTMTRAFNFPKSVVFKVIVMLWPHFFGDRWGGHSGNGVRSLKHRLIGGSSDTLLKEPGLCSQHWLRPCLLSGATGQLVNWKGSGKTLQNRLRTSKWGDA